MQFITLPALCARLGIHRASVYRLIKRKALPAPVKIGGASRWVESEIEASITLLMEARRG